MCGVLAVWNRNGGPVDLASLARGVAGLRHRGPDDEGYVLINSRTGRAVACAGPDTRPDLPLPSLESVAAEHFDLALGHRRLSIVDRSAAGHQPMSAAAGTIWLVFNGMIHNFIELRSRLEARGHAFAGQSDTEVVLRAYEAWGTDCVAEFNGMWAFVLWDGRTRRLFVSRDRLGIKPLVYHVGETVAAFSSELKGLTAFPPVPRTIDAEALHHYLSLAQVPTPWTIYAQVRKLRPGHSLVVDAEAVTERPHWTLEPAPRPETRADPVEELHELLQDSVRLRLRGDAPVGSLLSGGVDSSVVTALAATMAGSAPLPTYHLTLPGAAGGDESAWAQRVATRLSTEHHRVPITPDVLAILPGLVATLDEPFAVSSVLGVHLLAREASRRVTVLLTGDGGDELFAGYPRYAAIDALWDGAAETWTSLRGALRAQAAAERVRWAPAGRLARARSTVRTLRMSNDARRTVSFNLRKVLLNDAEKRALYTAEWRERTRGFSTLSWLGARMPPSGPDRLARWQLHDIATSLPDEMLAKVDKATTACGLEARVPLLDHRVVELAVSLPARLKIAHGHGKWILKKLGERYVPHDVLYRPKHGFDVPLSEWLRREWRSFVRDTLSPSALRRVGLLEHAAVERVIAHHEAWPGFGTSHMVFVLLSLQMWHDVCHRPPG